MHCQNSKCLGVFLIANGLLMPQTALALDSSGIESVPVVEAPRKALEAQHVASTPANSNEESDAVLRKMHRMGNELKHLNDEIENKNLQIASIVLTITAIEENSRTGDIQLYNRMLKNKIQLVRRRTRQALNLSFKQRRLLNERLRRRLPAREDEG